MVSLQRWTNLACCVLRFLLCRISPPIQRSPQIEWVVSSAVEHYLDMVGVTGSIPVPPTIFIHIIQYLVDVRKCETAKIGILWRRRGGNFEKMTAQTAPFTR